MMKKPNVAVGIVSYNSRADLERCLPTVFAQRNVTLQVKVLDNASSDGTPYWIRKRFGHKVQIIALKQNVGFGCGHNSIINATKLRDGSYYLALNPDTVLDRSYIFKLVQSSRRHQAGRVTGKIFMLDQPDTIYSVGHAMFRDGFAFNIGYGMRDVRQFHQPGEVFGAPAVALLMSAGFIRDVSVGTNLFDPDMFMYNEDVDLDWRARLRGWKCWYEPRAVVFHRGSDPAKEFRAHSLANRFRSVLKNSSVNDLLLYNAFHMGCHVVVRFFISPFTTLFIVRRVMAGLPGALRQRNIDRSKSGELERWFVWSKQQRTCSPVTYHDRWESFLHKS